MNLQMGAIKKVIKVSCIDKHFFAECLCYADGKEFLAKEEDMDDIIEVDTQSAINRAKQFARDSGILVGISAGANILASEMYILKNKPLGAVITMLCDRGERYMSIYGNR